MSTGVPGQPNLELPQLETTFATAAARVPAGGAMQIAFGGDALGGARLVLAFKARFPLPRSESPRPDVVLLPLGALVSPALRQHVSIPDSTPLLTDQIPQQETDGDETSLLEADRILDLVRQTVGDDTTLEYLSGHLLVRGTAAARQAATAAIAHLQARLLETTVVRAYVDLDEVASSAPFAAPTADRRTLRLHQIVLPILSGRHAFAFRGLESTAIRTMLAEIAQEASITVPFVETRQGGLWLACRGPDPLAGDAFDAGVQFDHLGTPSLRSFGAFGALHLGDSDSLRATRIETLPIGRPTAVATGTSIALDGRLWRPTLRVLRTTVPEKQ